MMIVLHVGARLSGMDPNEEDSYGQLNCHFPLSALSEEALAQTTSYLSGIDISQLLCVGDLLLSAKLLQGGLCDVMCLGKPVLQMIKTASSVTTLRMLSPAFDAVLWHQLPPNTRHLIFSACNTIDAPDSGYKAPQMESLVLQRLTVLPIFPPLLSTFPNLKVLEFCDTPFQMTFVNLLSHLPEGLQELSLPRCCLLPETLPKLPSSLTSLSCQLSELTAEIARMLPANLVHLKLGAAGKKIKEREALLSLPSSLESLHLEPVVGIFSQDFSYLPPALTSLVMEAPNTLEGTQLPPKIKALTLTSHVMSNAALLLIPKSIQHLEFNAKEITEDGLHNLPPTLKSIHFQMDSSLTDKLAQFLPSGLQSLTSTSKAFTNELIPLLPRHLTSLALPSALKLTNGCVRHLPRTLTNLAIDRAYELNNNCLADMPPSLTSLSLYGNVGIEWRRLVDIPLTSAACIVFLNASSFKIQDGRVRANRINH